MEREIPVIISCDVDPSPEASIAEREKALAWTTDLFSRYGCRATFFCVAEVARRLAEPIRALADQGHEIGCHGLTHDETDEYNTLPESEQRSRLTTATKMLTGITGRPVVSFRGPRVKTSAVTQKILVELGYKIDASVCSQRLDFFSSNLVNPGWIIAPRKPYHPSERSPYRRGSRPLLVVPLSAMVLPFLSGLVYTFGLGTAKMLFTLLYRESRLTGKPIVYLLHPAEFALRTGEKRRDFSVRVEGIKLRRSPLFFEQDSERRFLLHERLFNYIASRDGIRFMTMATYEQTYGTSDEK